MELVPILRSRHQGKSPMMSGELTTDPPHPPEDELWRCEGCGKEFHQEQLGHSRAAHARDCDGNCRNCPVEEQCGPITRVR